MGEQHIYQDQKKASLADAERGNVQIKDAAARGLGIRHLETLLMATAAFMAYSLRSNISVAIVAMVRDPGSDDNSTSTYPPKYDWDEETKGYVLSSFFCGYLITQIPAGILTEKFGGHRFLCGAIFNTCLLTVLMPQCAYIGGWQLVCANRMMQGISQGFVFPSLYTLLGVWVPFDERGRLTSIALGGQLLGTVASNPLTGLLSSVYGWPSVFYSFGAFGIVVSIVIYFLGADTPSDHRFIGEEEKHYIHNSLGGAKVKMQTPWKPILTSVPLWAAIVSSSLSAMVYLTFLMVTPTYMGTVLKFNMQENGLVSALPFLVCWLMSFVFSWSCDYLITRQWMRLTSARKLFNSISTFGPGICMGLMPFTDSATISVLLLTASFGFIAASFLGIQANFVDLVPNFSGTVFSIGNFFAACTGVFGPIMIGFIVSEAGSREQWRFVLLLNAGLMILSNVIFLIWGTAETQWWNWPNSNADIIAKEKEEKKEIQLNPIT